MRNTTHHMLYATRKTLNLVWIGLVLMLFGLSSCSTQPLLADMSVSAQTLSIKQGEEVSISYTIGQRAIVSVYLVDAEGNHQILRDRQVRQPSTEPYSLRFRGSVPTQDPVLKQRVLPSGTYEVVVEAADEQGAVMRDKRPLQITDSDVPLPAVEDLLVSPTTISPNADAIDDVAEITYRLPVTTTVDIEIAQPDGKPIPLVTGEEEEAALHRHTWNGKTPDGILLADGVYTYTVRARDRYGNLVERRGNITITGSGQPEALITYSYMAPQAIMLGDVITVTMRVKNTGQVPIRTYGPPSGYEYHTDEVFSSVEQGRYSAKPGGFWRIGVDWDANSGGAAKRYPYRWAISPRPPEAWRRPYEEDWLMPGEEAEVIGRILIRQPETKMGFYVGLIQDGVGFFQDRTGRTIIKVGF